MHQFLKSLEFEEIALKHWLLAIHLVIFCSKYFSCRIECFKFFFSKTQYNSNSSGSLRSSGLSCSQLKEIETKFGSHSLLNFQTKGYNQKFGMCNRCQFHKQYNSHFQRFQLPVHFCHQKKT